jgi:putative membrane protein
MLQTLPINPTLQGLVYGLALGVSLFAATALSNILLKLFVLKKDPVYDLRRIAALSLFSWIFWLPFILMGALAAVLSPQWAVRLCILGFSAALILRFIALYVTSSSSVKSLFAASVLPPFLYVAPFVPFWLDVTGFVKLFLSLLCALVAAFFSSFLFIAILNGVGRRVVGFPSLSIFKAFLLNWVADLNEPFEYFLDFLGEERDVEVSILRFDKEKGSIFIVVPSVHPGPFKNIGSSLLPSMLKESLERSLESVACVPLGLLGHEFDLASQRECHKIIDHVVKSAAFTADDEGATPSVAFKNDMATVCCQAFGKTVLASFSLAPHTTEDLPPELGIFVQEKAWKLGFKDCVFVNAHNSIDGVPDLNRALASLESSASACLERISSLDWLPFKVGAAVVKPREFSLSEGMGPGGITAVVVEVEGQKTAYVVFDGNNMVSDLREKILSALQSLGISGGEVFTTDTHSVNAVTLTARGYHPIGEVMDHEKVIGYVKEAVGAAIADLSPAKAGFRRIKVQRVKVIGREALEKLCMLPDIVTYRAKLTIIPLYAATFLFLMLILLIV